MFYKRLTLRTSKYKERVVDISLVIAVAILVTTLLCTTLSCKPLSASWNLLDYMLPNRKCLDQLAILLSLSIIHVVFNVLLLILPIQMVWSVKLPLRMKVALTILFCFGGLTCVFPIIRMAYLKNALTSYDLSCQYSSLAAVVFHHTNSHIDTHVNPVIFGQLEVTFSLILASFPALAFLLVKLVPKRWRKPNPGNESKKSWTVESSNGKDEHVLIKQSKGPRSLYSYELGQIDSGHDIALEISR
jgi:hypothetical protein